MGHAYQAIPDTSFSSQNNVTTIYVTQGCHSRRKVNFERGEKSVELGIIWRRKIWTLPDCTLRAL